MYINVNMNEVKDTNDEETLVTGFLLIKVPGYFKPFDCGKDFSNNLDATYEHVCMENLKYK